MSKKKSRKPQMPSKMQCQSQNGHYWKVHRVIALILCLGLTSLILAQWKSSRGFVVTPSPSPQSSPSPQLSKEYIYAGGKLVATEEPGIGGGSSPLSSPGSLVADGSDIPRVNISWTASTGGTVASYHIERCENFSLGPSCYSTVTDVSDSTLSYPDSGVVAGRAYLYRVRAVDSSGNYSSYSIDLATTVAFTQNPLVSYAENPANATQIRAEHFTQLRDAVNAVRKLVNPASAPFTWTDTPPQSGGAIYKSHINDLRTNLRDALVALGFTSPQYDAPDPMVSGQQVKATHVQQLRNLVK
jgi:hypothetical protein